MHMVGMLVLCCGKASIDFTHILQDYFTDVGEVILEGISEYSAVPL